MLDQLGAQLIGDNTRVLHDLLSEPIFRFFLCFFFSTNSKRNKNTCKLSVCCVAAFPKYERERERVGETFAEFYNEDLCWVGRHPKIPMKIIIIIIVVDELHLEYIYILCVCVRVFGVYLLCDRETHDPHTTHV